MTFELPENAAENKGFCSAHVTANEGAAPPIKAAIVDNDFAVTPNHTNSFVRHGTHVVVELSGAPFVAINSSGEVRDAMMAAATAGGLTIVDEKFFDFPVMGSSSVFW